MNNRKISIQSYDVLSFKIVSVDMRYHSNVGDCFFLTSLVRIVFFSLVVTLLFR